MEEAKQLLKSLRYPVDAWLLYTEAGVIHIIIDQPLLLYTLVAQSSLRLAPLTDCFKCVVKRLAYEGLHWRSTLVLLTSKKAMVKLPIVEADNENLGGDTSSEPGSPMEVQQG